MKRIHFRVDDFLYDKLNNYDLSINESVRRGIKQVKRGKLIIQPSKFGRLKHIIKAEVPDELGDVEPQTIRDALLIVFSEMTTKSIRIDKEDLKYKENVDELMS